MGLFSSKSHSSSSTTTNYNDNSSDLNNASSIGNLSSDNKVLGAGSSYVEQGLTGENLNSVLGTAESLYDKSSSVLSQTFDKYVTGVQSSAAKAIETTAQAYAESDDELRRTIDGLRPIAMYIMFAAITYFIFRGKK